MNILCTLYISNKKLGTVVSLPRNMESIANVKHDLTSKVVSSSTDPSPIRFGSGSNLLILTDQGTGPRIDLQSLETKVVDEPLRKLSSNEYVVITDKMIMYKDKMYQFFGTLPSQCQWRAIPMVKIDDVIDYKPVADIDEQFLREGYAKELRDAAYILVPPDWDNLSPECTPFDLLIKKADGISDRSEGKDVKFHPFSGRKGIVEEPYEIEGRYIFLTSLPVFEGECKYPPFTYNVESLFMKCSLLQDRLQVYGENKVESVCASMRSLAQRLKNVNNQFMACSVYDDVVSILEKAKTMD